MINLIHLCFFLAVFLGLRFLPYSRRSIPKFAIDAGIALFCFLWAAALSLCSDLGYLELLSLLGAALICAFLVRKKKPTFSFTKMLGFTCLMLISSLLISLGSFQHFIEGKPLLKVVVTGKQRQEWVEWKNPENHLQKGHLPAHEVRLETLKGEVLADYYLYGDLVGVRTQVIRFRPFLNLLGVSNLWSIDILYNGYHSAEKYQVLPIQAKSVVWRHPFFCYFKPFWQQHFFKTVSSFWIKSASLESRYFPLVDEKGDPLQGNYLLKI